MILFHYTGFNKHVNYYRKALEYAAALSRRTWSDIASYLGENVDSIRCPRAAQKAGEKELGIEDAEISFPDGERRPSLLRMPILSDLDASCPAGWRCGQSAARILEADG